MTLYAFCDQANSPIKRVPLSNDVQQSVEAIFRSQEREMRHGRVDEVEFDGEWNPERDEFCFIHEIAEASEMRRCSEQNALAVPEINATNFAEEGVKALFVGLGEGPDQRVLVQKFSTAQILNRRVSLLSNGNQFSRLNQAAFSLATTLTAIIEGGRLKFTSYHNLRSVFSVANYFIEATDEDIDRLAGDPMLLITDVAHLKEQALQVERRLLHKLRDCQPLRNLTALEIQGIAGNLGIRIEIDGGRLIIPNDRLELRRFLRFMDDALYRAPLSERRFMANSKREV